MEPRHSRQPFESMPAPTGKVPAALFSPLDPRRFNHLGEEELLQRIGTLLATALARSRHVRQVKQAPMADSTINPAAPLDPLELIQDPVERRLVRLLGQKGPSTLRDLAIALDIPPRVAAQRLRRLCLEGLCEVWGKACAARYQIRADHSQN